MDKKGKIRIGISVGDINGIGIEVILKTFEDARMLTFGTIIIFSSTKIVSYHKKAMHLNVPVHGIDHIKSAVANKLNVLNIDKNTVEIEFGKETKVGGDHAFQSLKSATEALKNGEIDVLVTAPINKNNIQSEEFKFQGHTEFLENQLEGDSLMILMTSFLRIGLITGHIPVKKVAETITPKLIITSFEVKIMLAFMCASSLLFDFCKM